MTDTVDVVLDQPEVVLDTVQTDPPQVTVEALAAFDAVDVLFAPDSAGVVVATGTVDSVEVYVDLGTGAPGPPGEPGQQGPPGTGVTVDAFQWHQDMPAEIWRITHDLGTFPQAVVVDSANYQVYGDVQFLGPYDLTIEFSFAFSGVAYLL